MFPIDWPEPFGLVMIEAMACGTPVLAFRHGSVPEIIEQGVTGSIVDTMEEAVQGAARVLALDRAPSGGASRSVFPPRAWHATTSALYRALQARRDAQAATRRSDSRPSGGARAAHRDGPMLS